MKSNSKKGKQRTCTRLYYFTADKWALDDLQKQRIKISRFADLNDPYELGGSRVKNFPELDKGFRDTYREERGLLCFSKGFNASIMWSHYADKHKGVCFGFDIRDDKPLYEVKYVSAPEDIEFPEELADEFRRSRERPLSRAFVESVNSLSTGMFTHKHKAWEYECEVRALVTLTDKENGMYFYSMREKGTFLKEVILGVRSTLKPEAILQLLKAFQHKVSLFEAQLCNDSFEIKKKSWFPTILDCE